MIADLPNDTSRSPIGASLSRPGFLVGAGLMLLFALLTALAPEAGRAAKPRKPKRLLIVTVTKGFRHGDSIPIAEQTIADLGTKTGEWTVDYARTDEDLTAKMSAEGLKQYDGVVFASTTGSLPLPDKDAFLQWIRDGHAFIGTHAATDTFHDWPAYLDMIGGEFKTHEAQVTIHAKVDDTDHPATKMLGQTLEVHDEIYQIKNADPTKLHLLLSLDHNPNHADQAGFYPLAWTKEYGKGRVFYTALGHRPDVWQSAWYPQHLQGGIEWALGLKKGDVKPQTIGLPAVP